MTRTPIVTFAAPSGTGKTTVIEALLGALTARGLRVGAAKHHHGLHELDVPGKDSWRMRTAGAAGALLVSAGQLAYFEQHDGLDLRDLVDRFFSDRDLVVAEGFRSAAEATVVVRRSSSPRNGDWEPPTAAVVIATVTDVPDASRPEPQIGFDEAERLADLLVDHFDLLAHPTPESAP